MTNRLEHPLDQMVSSFGHHNTNPAIFFSSIDHFDRNCPGSSVFERDPSLQSTECLILRSSPDLGKIDSRDGESRMGEDVGKIPVVRENEQPLRVEIQSADRVDPPLYPFEEVHHGRSFLGIFDRRQNVFRFVEKDDNLRLKPGKPLPVNFNEIFRGIGFEAHGFNHVTIDRYPSLENHLLRFSPRGDSGLGQNFLYSLC